MRPIWMLAALAGLMAAPAVAQTKIAPTRHYSDQAPTEYTTRPSMLDKTYGMPKSVMQDLDQPQRTPATTQPQEPPESFKGLSTHAKPDARPSEAPNFFQETPGIGAADAQASDVPNFFQGSPDPVPANGKAKPARPGYATMETPMSTTDAMSSGDTTSDNFFARNRPAAESTTGDIGTPDAPARQ